MARGKKKKGLGWQAQILIVCAILLGAAFSAISMVLTVGMVPTIVAMIVDRSKGRVRSWTVGFMNFAGCIPFLMEIFKKGNHLDLAIKYIVEPRTIVVIYVAAAMGYLIDWAVTGIAASMQVSKAKARLKEIDKEQKELVERWGAEVTGTTALDEYGFPVEPSLVKGD